MHSEGHDAGGEDVVLHVGVPCCPGLFEHIEVDIIMCNVVEIVAISDGGGVGGIPGRGMLLATSRTTRWEKPGCIHLAGKSVQLDLTRSVSVGSTSAKE